MNTITFTPVEVASRYNVPTKTVLRAIKTGELQALRFNSRVIRINENSVIMWHDSLLRKCKIKKDA